MASARVRDRSAGDVRAPAEIRRLTPERGRTMIGQVPEWPPPETGAVPGRSGNTHNRRAGRTTTGLRPARHLLSTRGLIMTTPHQGEPSSPFERPTTEPRADGRSMGRQ